jgi:hypothetical protein
MAIPGAEMEKGENMTSNRKWTPTYEEMSDSIGVCLFELFDAVEIEHKAASADTTLSESPALLALTSLAVILDTNGTLVSLHRLAASYARECSKPSSGNGTIN